MICSLLTTKRRSVNGFWARGVSRGRSVADPSCLTGIGRGRILAPLASTGGVSLVSPGPARATSGAPRAGCQAHGVREDAELGVDAP